MAKVSLKVLKNVVRQSWSKETSSDEFWESSNPSRGQCGPTSLVVQDYYRGSLRFGLIGYDDIIYGTHIWNVLPDGRVLDLTRNQYPCSLPEKCFLGTAISREEVLRVAEKKYKILKDSIEKLISGRK